MSRGAPSAPKGVFVMSSRSPWITVKAAAAFLGLPVVTLRRAIERSARQTSEGVAARLDGITAQKFGRLWRIRLHAKWTDPSAGER